MNVKRTLIGFGMAAAVAGALACGSGGGDSKANDRADAGTGTTTGTTGAKGATKAPEKRSLTAADVKITLKITDKQCFGSAGCNVEWKIDNLEVDETLLRQNADHEVTYEVSGIKDGPSVNTLILSGDGTYDAQTGFGQTANKSKTLKAKVTVVEKIGL